MAPSISGNSAGIPIKIKVPKGYTVSRIAREYNTTIDTIKVLNNLKSVDSINAGDELIISIKQSKDKQASHKSVSTHPQKKSVNPFNKSFHIVEKGDYLIKIAKEHNLTLEELKDLNPDLNSQKLFVGQRVYLRKESKDLDINFGKLTTVPKAEIKKAQSKIKPLNEEVLAEHIIKSGDSIEKLAKKYVSDPRITLNQRKQQILEANGLTSTSVLKLGQKINIPNYKYIPRIKPVDGNDENFVKDIKFIFSVEGGLNSKTKNIDRGGLTNMGITQETYNKYQRDKAIDANIAQNSSYKSVTNITKEEAKEIYYNYYYKQSGADKIQDDKLRLAYLDTAINCGQKKASEFLNKSKKDVNKFYSLRKQHYDKIVKNQPSQRKFLQGWYNRIELLKKYYIS